MQILATTTTETLKLISRLSQKAQTLLENFETELSSNKRKGENTHSMLLRNFKYIYIIYNININAIIFFILYYIKESPDQPTINYQYGIRYMDSGSVINNIYINHHKLLMLI